MAKQDKKSDSKKDTNKKGGKGHIEGKSHKRGDTTKGARTGTRPKKDNN